VDLINSRPQAWRPGVAAASSSDSTRRCGASNQTRVSCPVPDALEIGGAPRRRREPRKRVGHRGESEIARAAAEAEGRNDAAGVPGSRRRGDRVLSRIREAGHPGVGDERDRLAFFETPEKLRDASFLARARAREARGRKAETRRELPRDPRVFAEDRVRVRQRPERSRGKVFQVANGRSHDEELTPERLCHRAAKIAWGDSQFAIMTA
jgi:hypothetical protein